MIRSKRDVAEARSRFRNVDHDAAVYDIDRDFSHDTDVEYIPADVEYVSGDDAYDNSGEDFDDMSGDEDNEDNDDNYVYDTSA